MLAIRAKIPIGTMADKVDDLAELHRDAARRLEITKGTFQAMEPEVALIQI